MIAIRSPLFSFPLCLTGGGMWEAWRNVIWRHFGFCELTHVATRGDCRHPELVSQASTLHQKLLLRVHVYFSARCVSVGLAFWPVLDSIPMQASHQYGISAWILDEGKYWDHHGDK